MGKIADSVRLVVPRGFLAGLVLAVILWSIVNRPADPPQVELPPIRVPAPWGACRVTGGGAYPWVGNRGQVKDSVYVGLVCPDGIAVPRRENGS